MALAVVLLTGAGLLIRSFVAMMQVDPGFRTEHAMAFRVTLQGQSYQRGEQIRNRVDESQNRLRALPGVTAVAATTVLPMSGLPSMHRLRGRGRTAAAGEREPGDRRRECHAGILPAVGTPLQRGRAIDDRDTAEAPRAAVINEAAVRRWFPDRDPIGRRVIMSGNPYVVVGIVGDILQRDPGGPVAPQLFASYAQRTSRSPRIVVRTQADPVALAPTIRTTVRALDPNLAIPEFTPLDQLVATAVARPRFYMSLLTLFAAVALALAATGIFGVMSYSVAQRSREIGIRIALGALARDVVWMIVGGQPFSRAPAWSSASPRRSRWAALSAVSSLASAWWIP